MSAPDWTPTFVGAMQPSNQEARPVNVVARSSSISSFFMLAQSFVHHGCLCDTSVHRNICRVDAKSSLPESGLQSLHVQSVDNAVLLPRTTSCMRACQGILNRQDVVDNAVAPPCARTHEHSHRRACVELENGRRTASFVFVPSISILVCVSTHIVCPECVLCEQRREWKPRSGQMRRSNSPHYRQIGPIRSSVWKATQRNAGGPNMERGAREIGVVQMDVTEQDEIQRSRTVRTITCATVCSQ